MQCPMHSLVLYHLSFMHTDVLSHYSRIFLTDMFSEVSNSGVPSFRSQISTVLDQNALASIATRQSVLSFNYP